MADANEPQQPMTSERLAEIRQLSFHQEKYAAGEMGQTDSIDVDAALVDLLAEVERLRAREAALGSERDEAMEVVAQVAQAFNLRSVIVVGRDGPHVVATLSRNAIEQARALLASAEQEGERHGG